jgi:hypothetical protein
MGEYFHDMPMIFYYKYGKYRIIIILTSSLKLKMMKSTWVWKQDHVADQEDETAQISLSRFNKSDSN